MSFPSAHRSINPPYYGDDLYDGPDTNAVVRKTREQGLAIGRPSERQALWALEVVVRERVWLEFIDDRLGLEVKDLDARRGRRAEPVTVRGEDERVDNVTSLERVEVLAIVEVPKHGDAVFATGSGERSIGGDGEGVDVTGVAVVVGLELALVELPDLARADRRARASGKGGAKKVESQQHNSEEQGTDDSGKRRRKKKNSQKYRNGSRQRSW